ncbi:hypothetical protein PAMP_018548 [Pampus punctatissimus]
MRTLKNLYQTAELLLLTATDLHLSCFCVDGEEKYEAGDIKAMTAFLSLEDLSRLTPKRPFSIQHPNATRFMCPDCNTQLFSAFQAQAEMTLITSSYFSNWTDLRHSHITMEVRRGLLGNWLASERVFDWRSHLTDTAVECMMGNTRKHKEGKLFLKTAADISTQILLRMKKRNQCSSDTEASFFVFYSSLIIHHTYSSFNPEKSQVDTGDTMDISAEDNNQFTSALRKGFFLSQSQREEGDDHDAEKQHVRMKAELMFHKTLTKSLWEMFVHWQNKWRAK